MKSNSLNKLCYSTLNIDNPKLNCRLRGYEKFSPIRVVLDKYLDIGFNTYIYKSVKRNNSSLPKAKIQ